MDLDSLASALGKVDNNCCRKLRVEMFTNISIVASYAGIYYANFSETTKNRGWFILFYTITSSNGPLSWAPETTLHSSHLDFPMLFISNPLNSNSNFFASPHLNFQILFISKPIQFKFKHFGLPTLISQFCSFPTL